MTHNKAAINEALKVFDDEEAILDLKLARMRYLYLSLRPHCHSTFNTYLTFSCVGSHPVIFVLTLSGCRTRSKALKREDASLDTLHSEYSDLLLALDPVLMKAYKKSLDSDSQLKKKRFLNDFTSGVDVNEGARATSERGHSRPGAGSGRGRGAEELSEDSNAWKGAGLTSSSKLDGVSPSPSPSQSSSWAELASNKRDEKSKSLGATGDTLFLLCSLYAFQRGIRHYRTTLTTPHTHTSHTTSLSLQQLNLAAQRERTTGRSKGLGRADRSTSLCRGPRWCSR